ncbi:hypothetical protein G6F22_017960 [Rhizopus arrhizus]|nr:hypothetical protein G6F22_017960 [Rhizopus arrhizus]
MNITSPWHVQQVGAGALLEELQRQVVGRARAGGGCRQLAGFLLGGGQHVVDRLVGRVDVHGQQQRELGDAADVGELGRVVRQLGVQRRVERQRAGVRRADHVAGGFGLRNGGGADDGGGAGAVLDHDGLAQGLFQAAGNRAGDDVGAAAGRVGHDPADGLRGPGLGGSGGGGQRQGGQRH